MASIFDDLKRNFVTPNNALNQLIIINVVIYVILGLLSLFGEYGSDGIKTFAENQFTIPSNFMEFLGRPWTLLTYSFNHFTVIHILFNMLALFWFGRLISEYLGSAKVVNLYVLGAISGAVVYLVAYNIVPQLVETNGIMRGASAAVFAISVASATLLPDYRFYYPIIGPVKIKYIVGIYVIISLINSSSERFDDNIGGNLAHLGGAGIGFLYIRGLQAGTDFGLWIQKFIEGVKSIFSSKPKIKVTYKKDKSKSAGSGSASNSGSSSSTTKIEQDEIDRILDKISEKGYESLSKEEKQKLFNASKR